MIDFEIFQSSGGLISSISYSSIFIVKANTHGHSFYAFSCCWIASQFQKPILVLTPPIRIISNQVSLQHEWKIYTKQIYLIYNLHGGPNPRLRNSTQTLPWLVQRPSGRILTCAALPFHGPHQVIGPLLAVQGLQQVKHIIIKHQMDQVEGPCKNTQDERH